MDIVVVKFIREISFSVPTFLSAYLKKGALPIHPYLCVLLFSHIISDLLYSIGGL